MFLLAGYLTYLFSLVRGNSAKPNPKGTVMKKDTILILTHTQDGIHTDSVIAHLQKMGEKHFRFDSDVLSKGETTISFHCHDDSYFFVYETAQGSVDSRSVKSVWYRRPNNFEFQINDLVQKEFAERELKTFLDGLWQSLTDAFWISDPISLERARKKVYQLKIARELRFDIPDTIITNSPSTAEQFIASQKGKVVFKPLEAGFLDYGDKNYIVPATIMTDMHKRRLELVRKLPSLFQSFVEKQYDMRVTIVGSEVFAVRIDSQAREETSVDWRHPNHVGQLPHTLIELPLAVQDKCIAMMHILGLQFAAFDFAVDLSERYIFLEVNPNGQWYWLEHLTGVPISVSISDTLASCSNHARKEVN